MIIDLTFKNFRSIKNEQIFSLEANSSNLKTHNIFQPIKNYKNLRLVKSAVIYGSNASGKSNLIRLMWTLRNFVLNSIDLKSGDLIPENYFDPFLLDINSKNQPTEIIINFIPFNNKRHRYIIKFNKQDILYEYLGVYDTNWISKIFERKDGNEYVEFGDGMIEKEDKRVPKNHLYLSKIGNSTNDQLRDIYLYFKSIEIWNIPAIPHTQGLYNMIQQIYNDPEKSSFRKRLSKLISVADTKIIDVHVSERPNKDFDNLPVEIKEKVIGQLKFETFGVHSVYNELQSSGVQMLSFNDQESQGTRMMFAIGGMILDAFEKPLPTVMFLDEFDNSLHPDLAKFLIELFHNPKVNKNNSQLFFASHETTLLDKKIFRKDQIWFGEKNKYGETEFYSVKDFKDLKNIRSDIPFDKWYRTGKFGAVPNIRKFEFYAEYEE